MNLEDWRRWWRFCGERELRELLLREWDPIHVDDSPTPEDEYDSYLGQIVRRLRDGEGTDAVAAYLSSVREERMGMPENADEDERVATEIVAWYEDSTRRSTG
jgi:hypothetical protein